MTKASKCEALSVDSALIHAHDESFAAYCAARDLAWATHRFEDARSAALIWAEASCLAPEEMAADRAHVDVASPAEEFANWLAALYAEQSSDGTEISRAPERAWGRFLDAHLPPERRIGAL